MQSYNIPTPKSSFIRVVFRVASLLLLATLLAACTADRHDPVARQLRLIDSLADVDPDSADVLLKPILSPQSEGREKEVALLLRIKTDDKLYRPVTHYRDTILRLISYFEHHPKTLPSLLGSTGPALPYLYAGRIFADLGDAPQALDYYQRALDAQPDYREDEPRSTTKQRGLLYSLMGTQLYYQGLYRDALCQYDKAYLYDKLASDTIGVIYDLRDAAEQYKYLNINDSSLLLYGNALQLSLQCNNEHLSRVVQSQIARLYIAKGNFTLAHRYMRPAINHIDTIDISSTYALASVIYKNVGDMDSALYCYDKLLHFGNVTGKSLAFKELASIAIERRELSSALSYLSQYTLYIDSIRKMENAETVARMHAAYNYQKHERETSRLKVANARMEKMILASAFVIAFLAITIYLLAYRNNQNKLLYARQKQLLKEIKNTQEKSAINQEEAVDNGVVEFRKTDIYSTFLLLSQTQERNVSKAEWEAFSKEFGNSFPDFRQKLSGMFNLSTKQYRVCMLRKVGFGTTAICFLACYEKASVYSIYKRLYQQATGSSGNTADFDNLLKTL